MLMGSVLTGSKVVRGAMNVHSAFKGGRRERPTNGEEGKGDGRLV